MYIHSSDSFSGGGVSGCSGEMSSMEISALRSELSSAKASLLELGQDKGSSSNYNNFISKSPGVVLLGMHRSGTSMLGGLLSEAMVFRVGAYEELIHGADPRDNVKGFFERTDIVLQNDELIAKERVDYGNNLYAYDAKLALKQIMSNEVPFKKGEKGPKFLNEGTISVRGMEGKGDKDVDITWMQKDPRMCITLRTWLPLFDRLPAIELICTSHPQANLPHCLSQHREQQHAKVWSLKQKTNVFKILPSLPLPSIRPDGTRRSVVASVSVLVTRRGGVQFSAGLTC